MSFSGRIDRRISMVFLAILVMVPGTAGLNDYGEDPRPRADAGRAAGGLPHATEARPA